MRYCFHCFKELPDDIAGKFCPECGQEHSTSYAQSYELPAGTFLNHGRYFVGDTLGSGGFGITYLGFDTSLKKKVVIKETFYIGYFKRNVFDKRVSEPLTVQYDNTISLDYIMKKTRKECEALSEGESLNNIMRVYDIFSENNTAYIITEYIQGGTLADKIEETGKIEWSVLYANLRPLMRSLDILHRKGILHRDIKPQNIMIKHSYDFDDQYILIDFGLARSTQVKTLSSMGIAFSPGYSPFEQRSLTQPDGTYTDVYAMAATIYHALTGESPNTVTNGLLEENFPLISKLESDYGVPKNAADALRYSLNPNFNERCQTISELLDLFDSKQPQNKTVKAAPAEKSVRSEPELKSGPVAIATFKSVPRKNSTATVYAGENKAKPNDKEKKSENTNNQKPLTYNDIVQPEYSAPKKSKKGIVIGAAAAVTVIGIGIGIASRGGSKDHAVPSSNVGDTTSSQAVSSVSSQSSSKEEPEVVSDTQSESVESKMSISDNSYGIDWSVDPTGGEGANGASVKLWCPDRAINVMQADADEFEKKISDYGYGNVSVEIVGMGEDVAVTQLFTDSSSAADVFGFASDMIYRLSSIGLLLEVTGENKEFVVDNNSEESVKACQYNGSIMAFPETNDNSYCLVYDKNYVSDEQAKTLEGTLAACKAAGKKFVMDAGNGYYSCLFMFTGGLKTDGFEDDGETQKFTKYDEATMVKTMLAFQQLLTDDYRDIFLNGDTTKVADGFKAGTVAAGIDGSWDFKNIKESLGDDAGFAPLPTINVNGSDRQIINLFGYKMIGVKSNTKYPNTALSLARFLTSEECQTERAEQINWGPSNKKAAESDIVKSDPAISAILTQSEYSVPQTEISSLFWTPMGMFGEEIVDKSNKLDEAACKELIKKTIANIRDE